MFDWPANVIDSCNVDRGQREAITTGVRAKPYQTLRVLAKLHFKLYKAACRACVSVCMRERVCECVLAC